MILIPAKNSPAESVANCDSCGTTASKISVERRVPIRPDRPLGGTVRPPLQPAIKAHSVVFPSTRRNFYSPPRVSVAGSMRGTFPRQLEMFAHSIRNLNSECRPGRIASFQHHQDELLRKPKDSAPSDFELYGSARKNSNA